DRANTSLGRQKIEILVPSQFVMLLDPLELLAIEAEPLYRPEQLLVLPFAAVSAILLAFFIHVVTGHGYMAMLLHLGSMIRAQPGVSPLGLGPVAAACDFTLPGQLLVPGPCQRVTIPLHLVVMSPAQFPGPYRELASIDSAECDRPQVRQLSTLLPLKIVKSA